MPQYRLSKSFESWAKVLTFTPGWAVGCSRTDMFATLSNLSIDLFQNPIEFSRDVNIDVE